MTRRIVLVKHAQPVLDPKVPARLWRLGQDGERQAARLASRLDAFKPFTLVCSGEPKAARTCEIVARELGVSMQIVDGLEEFDRPVLPLMSDDEHERLNAQIFDNLARRVIGRESGDDALRRFRAAVMEVIDETPDTHNVVVVTHGTVISMFVAERNEVDALELWKRLSCPSFVVLTFPAFRLLQVVAFAA